MTGPWGVALVRRVVSRLVWRSLDVLLFAARRVLRALSVGATPPTKAAKLTAQTPLVASLPDEALVEALGFLELETLAHAGVACRRLLRLSRGNDWLWREQLGRLWAEKWNPELGTRKWWAVWASARKVKTPSEDELQENTAPLSRAWVRLSLPSLASNCRGSVRFVRELSWYESCAASLKDARMVDVDLTEIGDWFIKFRTLDPEDDDGVVHHAVAFHGDGVYEDGVFFVRDSATYWGLDRDQMLISTGGSHAVQKKTSWAFSISNRFVLLTPAPKSRPDRVHCCRARGLRTRQDLNGRICVVEDYSAETDRYTCFFPEPPDPPEEEDVRRPKAGRADVFDDLDDGVMRDSAVNDFFYDEAFRPLDDDDDDDDSRSALDVTPVEVARLQVGARPRSHGVNYGPGETCALRPRNVQLPRGTRVTGKSLSGRVRGVVHTADGGSFKYSVQTSTVVPVSPTAFDRRHLSSLLLCFEPTMTLLDVDPEDVVADLGDTARRALGGGPRVDADSPAPVFAAAGS